MDPSKRNTWVLVVFGAVTNLIGGVIKVALPLLATWLTTSPALVSGVLLALSLPWLLVALHVGVLVDRVDRRKLLWLANSMRIAVVLGLAAAVVTDVIALGILYGGAVILGVAEVIALVSAAAIIPDAVASTGRDRANVWIIGVETLCNGSIGPLLGGCLAAAGMAIALGISASGYLIALAILPLLVGKFTVTQATTTPVLSMNKQISEGLQFLRHQRLLRLLTFTVTILVTCWAAWYALMPLVATKMWGLSPPAYGALVGALGLGGIVGTLSVTTANRLFGRRWVMFANVYLTCSMVAVPALTTNVWAVGTGAFLGGMGSALWVVNSRSISQTLVRPEMMGRYNSIARLSSWGPIALGAPLAGILAQWLGYRLAFGVFAAATAVFIIPFLRTFTPALLAELEMQHARSLSNAASQTPQRAPS
ncbi:MFS transporter [Nonomuraea sp. M3C6]|uniref:MFS transporter n=1 Tax=Nonomuraea marmarensis TaxID=3351344 RepID=A0ABW7AQX6_9ACTN